MISPDLARALAASGLRWTPRSGDVFMIPGGELDGETFVVSELTIEPREYPSGTILAFNGTTEWALDSAAVEDTLWLPREDQLREALDHQFISLERDAGEYLVRTASALGSGSYRAPSAPDAYAEALLALLRRNETT